MVVPHPDDEALAAGGLILHQRASDRRVHVVAVTDGDAAYPDWDGEDLRAVRLEEQGAAFAVLRVEERDVVRLGIPDSGVAEHELELVDRLRDVVRGGDLLVAPWEHDVHPDHEACGRAAVAVADEVGCELVGSLVWAWRFVDLADHDVELLELALDAGHAQRRWTAMQCHRSQLDPPGGVPVVDEHLLATLRRDVEMFVRVRP